MKSWQLKSSKTLELHEAETKTPEEDEIKVKITKAVASSTDLSVFVGGQKDIYPIIPCRSAVGQVSEAVGEYKKGQKVWLSPYCTDGSGNCSIRGIARDGFLSDYVVLPQKDTFLLPEGLTEERALFIDDIALAISAFEALDIDKTEYLLVFGASAVNCIIAQLAIYYQAIPVIIDNDKDRLEVAQDCGAYYIVNSAEEDVKQAVKQITGGKFAPHAVIDSDAFSNTKDIFCHIRHKGNICIMGYNRALSRMNCDVSPILKYELSLLGVNNGAKEISSAINLLANNVLNVDCFIEKSVSFEDAPSLFEEKKDKPPYYKVFINC